MRATISHSPPLYKGVTDFELFLKPITLPISTVFNMDAIRSFITYYLLLITKSNSYDNVTKQISNSVSITSFTKTIFHVLNI